VRRTSTSWLSGLLAALIAVGGAPAAFAKPVKSYPPTTRLSSSIAATVGALPPTALALAQTATPTDTTTTPESGRSFFRTRTGVAALVLMVAGAGFVAYRIPKDNEKVHSPIR
jgi:hypothetical protein